MTIQIEVKVYGKVGPKVQEVIEEFRKRILTGEIKVPDGVGFVREWLIMAEEGCSTSFGEYQPYVKVFVKRLFADAPMEMAYDNQGKLAKLYGRDYSNYGDVGVREEWERVHRTVVW